MLLGQGAAVVYGGEWIGGQVTEWESSGGLALWEAEMDGHLAHERRRLRLIAVVLVLIGVLLAVGHALDDADGRSLLPLGLDDLIAGYPSVFAIMVAARVTWQRAGMLAGTSRRSHSYGP